MQTPFMSICVPTYNRAQQLKELIPNILNQTYQDYELVIVDNYSSDNTEEVVSSFKDERIRFYKNDHNIGSARNHNRCILEARGTYIKILHSDDRFTTESALEQLFNAALTHPEAGLITCGAKFPNYTYLLPFSLKRPKGIPTVRASMSVHYFGLPSEWLIKRSILPYTGFLIDSHICDCDFVMKAAYYYDCYTISEALVEHHFDGMNETTIANRLNGWEAMRFRAFPNLPFHASLSLEAKAGLSNYLHMSVLPRIQSSIWNESYHIAIQGVLDLLKNDPHLHCFFGEDREKVLTQLLDLFIARTQPAVIYEFMMNQPYSKPYADIFAYGFGFSYPLYNLSKKLKAANKQIVVHGDTTHLKYFCEAFPELQEKITAVLTSIPLPYENDGGGRFLIADEKVINPENTFLILADNQAARFIRYQLISMGWIEGEHFLPLWELL